MTTFQPPQLSGQDASLQSLWASSSAPHRSSRRDERSAFRVVSPVARRARLRLPRRQARQKVQQRRFGELLALDQPLGRRTARRTAARSFSAGLVILTGIQPAGGRRGVERRARVGICCFVVESRCYSALGPEKWWCSYSKVCDRRQRRGRLTR